MSTTFSKIQTLNSLCHYLNFLALPVNPHIPAQSHSVHTPQKMNFDAMNGGGGKESDLKQETDDDDASWPHFEEEDYIVFCFTEDGEIHIMEDMKKSEPSSSASSPTNKKPRPNSRKVNDEENAERDIEIYPEQETVISLQKSEENQSNGSRSSFAFPVLGLEWVGSPVHLPKPDGPPYLKKHRARCLFIHCCRF